MNYLSNKLTYVKRSLVSAMTSIKTEAINELFINQVNISNSIQIVFTEFSYLPTYFIFKQFNTQRVFNFYEVSCFKLSIQNMLMILNQIMWYRPYF